MYSGAFIGSNGVSYYDVPSAFKTMYLGPSSDNTKMIGIIKSKMAVIFNEVNSGLDEMIAAWQYLNSTTQATVKAQLTSFSTSANELKTRLQIYLNQVG